MDVISSMWGNFTLSKKEDVEVQIREGSADPIANRGQSCLVGRLLADRVVPKDYIRVHMLRAWKILGTVSFKVLWDNLFLLDFEHEWDKTHVMRGRPWLFDGNLMAIAEFDGFTPPSQMDFEKVAFWVRMYNLPLVCMGSAIGH
jgi:hypothetical protein